VETNMTAGKIDMDGHGIAVVVTQPSDRRSERYVVMAHGGPGGSKDGPSDIFVKLAAHLANVGIASVRFDMLGSGESDFAETTLAGEADQLLAVVKFARGDGCQRLGILAESLGAAAAVLGWPDDALAGAFLWPWFEPLVQNWPKQWYERLDDALAVVQAPTLLIHGRADTEVPCQESERAHHQCLPEPKRLVLVPGGDHCLRRHVEQVLVCVEVVQWFTRHL